MSSRRIKVVLTLRNVHESYRAELCSGAVFYVVQVGINFAVFV